MQILEWKETYWGNCGKKATVEAISREGENTVFNVDIYGASGRRISHTSLLLDDVKKADREIKKEIEKNFGTYYSHHKEIHLEGWE